MDKKTLRKIMIDKRDNIINRDKISEVIIDKFVSMDEYKNSSVIFTYVGFGSEINTKMLIEKALNDNKIVCVPKTDYSNRKIIPVVLESVDLLIQGYMGILEPIEVKKVMDKKDIDLVIVPGVAFDEKGNRLGYGGGFYDRFLADFTGDKVILSFDEMIVENIPTEDHDILVHKLLTEKRKINCK